MLLRLRRSRCRNETRFEHLHGNEWLKLIDHKRFLPADHLLVFTLHYCPLFNSKQNHIPLDEILLSNSGRAVSVCRSNEAPSFITVWLAPNASALLFSLVLSDVSNWMGLFLKGRGKDKLTEKAFPSLNIAFSRFPPKHLHFRRKLSQVINIAIVRIGQCFQHLLHRQLFSCPSEQDHSQQSHAAPGTWKTMLASPDLQPLPSPTASASRTLPALLLGGCFERLL